MAKRPAKKAEIAVAPDTNAVGGPLLGARQVGKIHFCDEDPRVLNMLRELGVKWTIVDVPVAVIDFDGIRDRNFRLSRKYRPERVTAMVDSFSLGVECPLIFAYWMEVGHPYNSTKHRMIDVPGGVHRTGTYKAMKQKTVPVYLLNNEDQGMLDDLRLNLNNLNGEGTPLRDRLAGARRKAQESRYDMSNPQVTESLARQFNLRKNTMLTYIFSQDALSIIESQGGKTAHLMDSHLKELKQLNDNHTVLAEAGQVANRCKLTSDETLELVKKVKRVRTGEKAKLAAIVSYEEIYLEGKVPVPVTPRPMWRLFMSLCNRFVNFFERSGITKPAHIESFTPKQNEQVIAMRRKINSLFARVARKKV